MPPSSNPAEIYENLRAATLERPEIPNDVIVIVLELRWIKL